MNYHKLTVVLVSLGLMALFFLFGRKENDSEPVEITSRQATLANGSFENSLSLDNRTSANSEQREQRSSDVQRKSWTLHRFVQVDAVLLNDPDELFPDALTLKSSGLTESQYIESLMSLLEEYAVIVKAGGYPTGLNLEITNALLGDNPRKIALLPQSHPRINPEGELVDSWGTPYFFHSKSLKDMDIRSAGPDMKFYTSDDVVSQQL